MKKKKKIKKLNQLNSIFNNFFFISPLLHEYSFFDPRWGPWTSGPANIAKAAAQIAVGKDRKDLGGKIFSKKKSKKKKKVIHSRFVRVILAQGPC